MTDYTGSLIDKIRQAIETGFLPDGDGVPVSVNLWLEDLIRQHEADMGDSLNRVMASSGSPTNTSEISEDEARQLLISLRGWIDEDRFKKGSERYKNALAASEKIREYLTRPIKPVVSVDTVSMDAAYALGKLEAETADQPVGKMLIADEKENVWHDDNGDIWEPIRARILERESGSHYRMALEHIREIWAGSECGEPKYAQEAYAINLCKEMYQEAVDALRNDIEGGKPDV